MCTSAKVEDLTPAFYTGEDLKLEKSVRVHGKRSSMYISIKRIDTVPSPSIATQLLSKTKSV